MLDDEDFIKVDVLTLVSILSLLMLLLLPGKNCLLKKLGKTDEEASVPSFMNGSG
jgi:competence protein ComGC